MNAKLSPNAVSTLEAIIKIAGPGRIINGWAGQPGIKLPSFPALLRAGMLEPVAKCDSCKDGKRRPCQSPLPHKYGDTCYNRVRVTDRGVAAIESGNL